MNKMRVLLLVGGVLAACVGCEQPAEDAAIKETIGKIKSLKQSIMTHHVAMATAEQNHAIMEAFYAKYGDTLAKQWGDSIDYCEGKKTNSCEQLRTSLNEFYISTTDLIVRPDKEMMF